MLDGRKFKDAINRVYSWRNGHFYRDGYSWNTFDSFDKVEEIFPKEEELFRPRKDDRILVRDQYDSPNITAWIFICMVDDFYACKKTPDSVELPSIWKYARPMPKKEWIQHTGESFPNCRPSDMIEYMIRNGDIETIRASNLCWIQNGNSSDIMEWRIA